MTGRYVRLLLTVVLLLAVASPSFAARRSSLSGNLLIQDADDMFFFPHLVTMHKRMVTFDFGPSTSSNWIGSGGMAFGNEQATIGLFAHRSDFLGAIDNGFFTRGDIDNVSNDGAIDIDPTNPITGASLNDFTATLNWIDVLVGFNMGENPAGVRLSVGRGNVDPNDPGTPPVETQDDVSAFNVILGTRLARFGADASVEFAYASANNKAAGTTEEYSPFHIGVGARRTYSDESDALRLGWLGMFSYTSGSVDVTPPTPAPSSSTDVSGFNLQLGAGPVYHPNARTNVAMYGTFEYGTATSEATGNKDTGTVMTIPGWNVAGEFDLTSWLQFRAGMRSRYVFASTENESGTPTVKTENKQNDLLFDWSTGVGLQFGSFNLDGYLDPESITTGTDVFGDQSQLFGLVTASMHF